MSQDAALRAWAAPAGGSQTAARASRWAVAPLAMVGATLVEAVLAAAFAAGAASLAACLVVHGATVAGLCLAHRRAVRRPETRMPVTMPLFIVATTALGPLGCLGAALSAAVLRVAAVRAPRFEQWYPAAVGEGDEPPSRALCRRLRRAQEHAQAAGGVAPFADVLGAGNTAQKQSVVSLIGSRFHPAFALALRDALSDGDPAVRVLAASAAARIENTFLDTSIRLEERHGGASRDFEVTLQLARHHDDYAHTGLLDDARAEHARSRALALYRDCERLQPQAPHLLHEQARLLVRQGREGEAVRALAPLVVAGAASAQSMAWYAESLFRCGRFAALRLICRRLQQHPDASARLSDRCREAVSLWGDCFDRSDAP